MRSAEAGIVSSQIELGDIYFKGLKGVPKSTEAGVRWYRLAAESGSDDAQFLLGDALREGKGVTKDLEEAIGMLVDENIMTYVNMTKKYRIASNFS